VVDYRLVMGLVCVVALVMVLFRQLYPAPLSAGTRLTLDVVILLLLAGAVVVLLKLFGVL